EVGESGTFFWLPHCLSFTSRSCPLKLLRESVPPYSHGQSVLAHWPSTSSCHPQRSSGSASSNTSLHWKSSRAASDV
ncbi:hypothetical protein BGW80DRAFT_1301477, partial [Lactifluus volemus]